VNALIDLVQAKPLGGSAGPSDDLFGTPKQPQAAAPMPRVRAPGGTSQLQLHDVPPSKVRMMTAPTNGGAIPSIKGPPPPRASRPSGTVPPPRPAGTPAPQVTRPAPAAKPAPAPVAKPAPVPVAKAAPAPLAKSVAKPAPAPHAKSTLPPPRPSSPAPPVPRPAARVTSAPVPKPVAQPPSRPVEAKRVEAVSPNGNPFAAMPTFAPPPRPSLDMTGDIVASESWFEASRAVEKFDDETFVGTAPVVKLERRRKMAVLKIVGTSVVFVVIGVIIGAYIAFHGDNARKSVAKAAPTAPAKTPPKTVVQPVAAEAAAAPMPTTPKLTDVRIDSTPPGAVVTLVDGDKTSVLGTTPLATSLDPSRGYDVVLALAGRPSKQVHLDVASSPHLEVAIDKPAAAPAPSPAPAPVPAPAPAPAPQIAATPAHRHVTTAARSAPVGQIADPGFDSFGGNGTLMVSTKPPCEIQVDGKATGMRTPQRAMPLSAGAHKITFVNEAEHINKTISVSITADHTTKLIKDLLN
jgi:hypothetical protein